MTAINIKRIYDEVDKTDGARILVDKLWPRGISIERAGLVYWAKELAPSHALRQWYKKENSSWEMFRKKYFAELDKRQKALSELKTYIKDGNVTFLFSSKNLQLNNAVALKEYIETHMKL